jgi:hypothetical protein
MYTPGWLFSSFTKSKARAGMASSTPKNDSTSNVQTLNEMIVNSEDDDTTSDDPVLSELNELIRKEIDKTALS